MTHHGSILLVDDEEKILKALGRALRDARHAVVETASPRHAQRLLGERAFDVLIVDNVMPELNGLDLIRELVASTPEGERPQILMMTAHATVESAIEAMRLGALDYLQKPFEIDELLVVVRRALEHQRLRTDYRYLVNERDEQFDHYGIIGRSRSMEDVFEEHLGPLGVPIVFNLPLGHGENLWTLPLGVTATIDADARTVTIDEPALAPQPAPVAAQPASR